MGGCKAVSMAAEKADSLVERKVYPQVVVTVGQSVESMAGVMAVKSVVLMGPSLDNLTVGIKAALMADYLACQMVE